MRHGPTGPQVSDNESVRFRPMLAFFRPLRPHRDKYAFEVKCDGFRA